MLNTLSTYSHTFLLLIPNSRQNQKNATDASALKKKETIKNKNAFMLNIYNMKAKKTKSG